MKICSACDEVYEVHSKDEECPKCGVDILTSSFMDVIKHLTPENTGDGEVDDVLPAHVDVDDEDKVWN